MSEQHIQSLRKARRQLLIARHEIAEKMAANSPTSTGLKPADYADKFVSIQTAIESADRDIADEIALTKVAQDE